MVYRPELLAKCLLAHLTFSGSNIAKVFGLVLKPEIIQSNGRVAQVFSCTFHTLRYINFIFTTKILVYRRELLAKFLLSTLIFSGSNSANVFGLVFKKSFTVCFKCQYINFIFTTKIMVNRRELLAKF